MTSKKNIHQRILAVTEAIGSFEKNGTHPHYKFAGIESVVAALQPLCIKHGICLIQGAEPGADHLVQNGDKWLSTCTVVTTAVNIDDPEDTVVTRTVGHGWDSTDKGIYKANSGARKYAIFGMFNVHAGEDDPEYTPEPRQKPSGGAQATRPASGGTGHPTEKQVNLMYAKAKKLFPDGEDSFRAYIKKWIGYTDDPEQLTYADGCMLIEWMKKKESEG